VTFGEQIRDLRLARGMSQSDLAAELNRISGWDTVTRQYVSRWESGKRHPRPELRRHLAQALGVPVSDLADMNRRTLLAAAIPLFDAAHIKPIRDALHAIDAVTGIYGSPAAGVVSVGQIERDTAVLCDCFQQSRYAELVNRLPKLLSDAQLTARAVDGTQRDRARAATSTAYQVAASTLWKFGQSDLAWLAAERGFRIAEGLGDPLLLSNGARRLARGLMATGHHREAVRLIRADMDRLEAGSVAVTPPI
jgi:transcriptional regulator with XRE-family HTH domain